MNFAQLTRFARRLTLPLAATLAAISSPAFADDRDLQSSFDGAFGTELRAPQTFEAIYANGFEQRIAMLADGSDGRIGVAALDLTTGEQIAVLGDQLFPMASTSKVAIAATYLEMVERGRYSLTSEIRFVGSDKTLPAIEMIEIMIARSNNPATDALLAAVGGPPAVNRWMRRQGINEFSIDRDIATLISDDRPDPVTTIDPRDAATPKAMVRLLTGLYRGDYLSDQSRRVLLGAMSRTVTGRGRIVANMPSEARVSHKTGSLYNTSSDIGIIETPDGRAIAVAIYVTGQGTRRARDQRIADIARGLYDGFNARARSTPGVDPRGNPGGVWTSAPRNGG